MAITYTDILPEDGIAVRKKGKAWHYETNEAYPLPLSTRNDGIDPKDVFKGVLFREGPSECMIPAFIFMLTSLGVSKGESDLEDPAQNGLFVILGDAGVGKSTLAKVMAKAIGAELFWIPPGSGGGDSLDELVKETRFGSVSALSIVDKLNKKLVVDGENSELGLMLREADLLKTETTENGKKIIKLDASKVMKDGGIVKLKEISQVVLPEVVNSSAPFSSGPGVLLKKLVEAQESGEPVIILIDEMNRYENLGSSLQNFWEVISGNRDECSVSSVDEEGNPKNYKFTSDGLKNVKIIGTGNTANAVDEPDARGLSKAFYSRVGVNPIEIRFGAEDYAHSLCREYLHAALPMYWEADKATYEADPIAAAKYFSERLTMGQTEAEMKSKPRRGVQQLLAQAGDFMQAADYLGNVFYGLQELCADRPVPFTTDKLQTAVSKEFRTLGQKPVFTPRQVNTPLKQWTFNLPSNDDPQLKGKTTTSENLGTNITKALIFWIDESFPKDQGLDNTRRYIGELLAKNNVITPEEAKTRYNCGGEHIEEMIASRIAVPSKSVAELINVGAHVKRHEELTAAQELLHKIVSEQYPEHAGTAPDVLFNLAGVAGMLDEYRLAQKEAEKNRSDVTGAIIPEVTKVDGKFTLLVGGSKARLDTTKPTNLPKMSLNEQLVAAIANEGAGDLSNLFMLRELSPAQEVDIARIHSNFHAAKREEFQGITAGTHSCGIHLTTLDLEVGKKLQPFSLLRNVQPEEDGKPAHVEYVMVGRVDIDADTAKYLKSLNISYHNSASPEGKEQSDNIISRFIKTGAKRVIEAAAAKETKTVDDIQVPLTVEEMSEPQKTDALDAYSKAWDQALTASNGLYNLSSENETKLYGKILTEDQLAEARNAPVGEERKARMVEIGAGVREAAAANDNDRIQGVIDKIAATASFVIENGEVREQQAVLPLKARNNIAR